MLKVPREARRPREGGHCPPRKWDHHHPKDRGLGAQVSPGPALESLVP